MIDLLVRIYEYLGTALPAIDGIGNLISAHDSLNNEEERRLILIALAKLFVDLESMFKLVERTILINEPSGGGAATH